MTFQYFFSDAYPGCFLQVSPMALSAASAYRFIKPKDDGLVSNRTETSSCLYICHISGLSCSAVLMDAIGDLWHEAFCRMGYGLHVRWLESNLNLIPDFFNHINSEAIGNIMLLVPYGILYPLYKENATLKKTLSDGLKPILIIELVQPIFGRSLDVNGIITNFTGILISSVVHFLIFKRIDEQLRFYQWT